VWAAAKLHNRGSEPSGEDQRKADRGEERHSHANRRMRPHLFQDAAAAARRAFMTVGRLPMRCRGTACGLTRRGQRLVTPRISASA
jgi:hypothetical protein